MSIDLSPLYALYSIDPRAVWKGQLALLIVAAVAVAAMVIPLNPESKGLRWLKLCGGVGIVLMAVVQFALLIRYLFYPSYLNHAEAMVADVSWLGWEGYPIYPPLDGGDVYGLKYGPALFQVTGFFLWLLGPSIAASKIPGLTAFLLSQILSFVTLRRAGAGVAEALTLTSVQIVVLAGFTDQGFVIGRSDPLLFLAAQTAVFVGTAAPTMLRAVVLGLLGGICTNLKIHGGLYILPAFVYCLFRSQNLTAILRLTCVAGLAAIIAVVVPFSPNNVSFFEYYHYFQTISPAQWQRWLFAQNIVFGAMCVVPLLLMCALFMPKMPRAFAWFLAAVIFSMTLIAIPTAVNGAGPYHFLPFLPSLLWAFVVVRRAVEAGLSNLRARGRYEGVTLGLIAALLFGYGPIVLASWSTALRRFADTPLVREAVSEIDRTLDHNPGLKVALGLGAAGSFDIQSLRVIPVFRGNPLPIDAYEWMGLKADGVGDEIIRRAISECRVDLWLVPSASPFVTISHYDGRNIYSADFIAEFRATYEKDYSGRIFDQWRCKR